MSRYIGYDDDNRVDIGTDLSLNRRDTPHQDFESSQSISASSVMPYAAPWSQYNPREPDYLSPYAPSEWPSDIHTLNELDAPYYPTSTFEESFARIGSGLRFSSPDTESPISCSPPPTPPLPPPWAAASSATAPSTLPTSRYTDNNTASCGQCSKEFTGSYRRSNLARHVRQKHQEAKGGPYTCTANGCFRVFQRQDARLKHTRNKHPELRPPPVQRRRGTENYSTDPYVPDSIPVVQGIGHHVGHWLPEEREIIGNHDTILQHMGGPSAENEQPPRAHWVFTTLRAKLDPATYSRTCDSFFTRWESIVQQLYENRSNAYPAYAKVLADIYSVVHLIDIGTHACVNEGPAVFKSRAPHKQRAGPRGNGSSSLGSGAGITSPTDRITKRSDRKQSYASNSGKNILVVLGEDLHVSEDITVDCPVFKHHFMNRTTPPCNGCRVGTMSQVRGHLNPVRAAGTHGGYPAFVKQCSRCKEDFIDAQAYSNHKTANNCASQSQIRGQIEIPWARQYLTLFPQATRVPLPWPGEEGWLPDSLVAECRMPRRVPASPSPFLGERRPRPSESRTLSLSPMSNTRAGSGHDVAMDFVLQDIVTPTFVRAQHPSSSNQGNYSPAPIPINQQVLVQGHLGNTRHHWTSLLQNWETLQRGIREGEMYLTNVEIRYLAEQAHNTYNATESILQHRHTQQEQSPAQTANVQQVMGPPQINMTYSTPVQQLPLQDASSGYYNASGISTQPSSYAYGTSSSRYHDSTFTNPSSVLQPNGSALLSPLTPSNYRRTSLPSGHIQDPSPLRRAMPSRLSLPENQGAPSPYMEPSVLDTPDDDEVQFYDLSRRLFQ